ncbi:unnamed protein product [Malus baccata var. baccata]
MVLLWMELQMKCGRGHWDEVYGGGLELRGWGSGKGREGVTERGEGGKGKGCHVERSPGGGGGGGVVEYSCHDLFYNVVEPYEYKSENKKNLEREAEVDASCAYLKQLLPLAWSHDPLTTLKLIAYLVHGRLYWEGFYTAAYWLHHNHPKTLLCYATFAKSIGKLFELPEILYRLLEDQDGRSGSEKKTLGMAKKAIERYKRDPDYKLLYDQVTDVYAESLKSDLEKLKQQNLKREYHGGYFDDNDDDDENCEKISDAADSCVFNRHYTWVPIRATFLCENIARKVFPQESYPEYQGAKEADYTRRVTDRLRKEFLNPLEKYYSSISTHMGFGRMPLNVEKYLEEVKADKSKIVANALLPHEVLRYVNHSNLRQAAELQWKAMVEDIYLKQGKFKNCLAVCDPGKTWIRGLQEDVSSALGILIAELSEEPWKGKVISFSKSPELHRIQGNDFRYKCEFVKRMDNNSACKCDFVKRMDRNSSTDIKKVFDLILEVAVNENLEPERMIKKVFAFSHQVFKKEDYPYGDCCSKTDYKAIQRKLTEKGYGDVVPQLVYWNLADKYFQDEGRPLIPYTQPGVTIVCDFSKNLLKTFLENDGEIGPDKVMEAAISDEEYQQLAVVD